MSVQSDESPFDKFSFEAQQALTDSYNIMVKNNHPQLDVEHILIAILLQPDSLILPILKDGVIDIELLKKTLQTRLSAMPKLAENLQFPTQDFYITPRLQQLFVAADRNRAQLQDNLISSKHMLLAMLENYKDDLIPLFYKAGMTSSNLQNILHVLKKSEPEPSANSATYQKPEDEEQPWQTIAPDLLQLIAVVTSMPDLASLQKIIETNPQLLTDEADAALRKLIRMYQSQNQTASLQQMLFFQALFRVYKELSFSLADEPKPANPHDSSSVIASEKDEVTEEQIRPLKASSEASSFQDNSEDIFAQTNRLFNKKILPETELKERNDVLEQLINLPSLEEQKAFATDFNVAWYLTSEVVQDLVREAYLAQSPEYVKFLEDSAIVISQILERPLLLLLTENLGVTFATSRILDLVAEQITNHFDFTTVLGVFFRSDLLEYLVSKPKVAWYLTIDETLSHYWAVDMLHKAITDLRVENKLFDLGEKGDNKYKRDVWISEYVIEKAIIEPQITEQRYYEFFHDLWYAHISERLEESEFSKFLSGPSQSEKQILARHNQLLDDNLAGVFSAILATSNLRGEVARFCALTANDFINWHGDNRFYSLKTAIHIYNLLIQICIDKNDPLSEIAGIQVSLADAFLKYIPYQKNFDELLEKAQFQVEEAIKAYEKLLLALQEAAIEGAISSKDEYFEIKSSYSDALNILGNVYYRRLERSGSEADYTKAINLYNQAIEALSDQPQSKTDEVAHIEALIAATFEVYYRGQKNEEDINISIDISKTAIQSFSGQEDKEAHVVYLTNRANALFSRYDFSRKAADLELAITYYEQSINTLEQIQMSGEGVQSIYNQSLYIYAATLSKLYKMHKIAGNDHEARLAYDKAMELYVRSIELLEKEHSVEHLLQAKINKAALITEYCDWEKDYTNIEEAINIYYSLLKENPAETQKIYIANNLSIALRVRIETTERSFRNAHDQYNELKKQYEGASNDNNFPLRIRLQAKDKAVNNLQTELLEQIKEAVALTKDGLKKAQIAKNKRVEHYQLNNLGTLSFFRYKATEEKKDWIESQNYYFNAIKLAKNMHDLESAAEYYINLGNLYREITQIELRRSVLENFFDNPEFNKTIKKYIYKCLGAVSKALKLKNRRRLELVSFEERNKQQVFNARYSRGLIEGIVEQGSYDVAYRLVSNFKARALLEQIKRRDILGQSLLKPAFPQKDVDEEVNSLSERYGRLVKQILETEVKAAEDTAQAERLPDLYIALERLTQGEIKKYDPSFAILSSNQPIRFWHISEQLDPETALIEHFIQDDQVLSFILHSGQSRSTLSSQDVLISGALDAQELEELAAKWLAIQDRPKPLLVSHLENFYQERQAQEHEILLTIYQKLYEPIVERLHELNSQKGLDIQKLVIVPHWRLHLFPLHALPIEENLYLSDKYQVSYVPSSALWLSQKQRKYAPLEPANFKMLALATDPTKSLLYHKTEVASLTQVLPSANIKLYYDEDGTSANFKKEAGQSHVIHLATHGIVNHKTASSGEFVKAALILALPQTTASQPDRPSRVKDDPIAELEFSQAEGYSATRSIAEISHRNCDLLRLEEIADECILPNTRLVYLNACVSGRHEVKLNDEFEGLPFAFFYAGARQIVATLWRIDDLSGLLFSQYFYKLWFHTNQAGASVLQQAARWLRNLTCAELCAETSNNPLSQQNLGEWLDAYNRIYGDASSEQTWFGKINKAKTAFSRRPPTERPFNHYRYWAAFVLIGDSSSFS